VEEHREFVIGLFTPDDPPDQCAIAKVKRALDLLAERDPSTYRRVQRYVRYIQIGGNHRGYLGKWLDVADVCELVRSYVESQTTTPLHIASTIVHESTHARLHRWGLGYEEHRRFRIERLCFLAQRAFAERVGGDEGQALAAEAGRQMARDPSYWSDKAVAGRKVDLLVDQGTPRWLARMLVWLAD
jgi:hypothetical protein